VGTNLPDDAGVYRIDENTAVILTVDFFTPVVDDPHTYGQIAAANALSDVYAMGGEPFAALNIVAYPARSEELPLELLGDILEGGAEKAAEAGVVILGGHTVDDAEPKYGLAVVGRIHPDEVIRKTGGKPGDKLVLTKPLGTGILTTALKRGELEPEDLEEAVRMMSLLNRDASRAMLEVGARSATDVTGYGLLGHLLEMLAGEGTGARLSAASLPVLEGARELATKGVVPGGTRENLKSASAQLSADSSVSEADQLILADAQTSGGLLIAISPEACDRLVERLEAARTPVAVVVGEITGVPGIRIEP
jgi:selenide,water dikinase